VNTKSALLFVPFLIAASAGISRAGATTLTESACNAPLVVAPCHFSTDGAQYDLSPHGHVHKSAPGAVDLTLQLPLNGAVVDRVLYARYAGDMILICELDDGESGSGLIVRLDSQLLPKWHLQFPTFNLFVGALEDRFLYQAGLGTVAKIDLERGTFVWKRQGLYDSKLHSFNSFIEPEVVADEVVFREQVSPQQKRAAHLIRVNKLTGQMKTE
jgi:hypothetical protein